MGPLGFSMVDNLLHLLYAPLTRSGCEPNTSSGPPFYQPAREVGGDFYDFHFLSEGRWDWLWGMQQASACFSQGKT
jgi:hypothetical protein